MGQTLSTPPETLALSPNKKWIETSTGTIINVDTVRKVHKRAHGDEDAYLVLEIGEEKYTSGTMNETDAQDFMDRLGGHRKRAKK